MVVSKRQPFVFLNYQLLKIESIKSYIFSFSKDLETYPENPNCIILS